ncbi:sulfite exporter TauE/SafE family protein [Marinomonas transparens]|uniref:Probable membrane transporter protein n=1 Tax=Marinomonas transparens TaxID=2795388 RepID=A0A934JQD1_9GAMM|nr:sulfite exporter TauE/SafE family protein [Marinomonas transparens]MBJ7536316.1 sulfite exporter TauE/SafE family protein [Marinomonas transparens]
MEHLLWWQYACIAAIFVWSGFVRSGLSFGGAVLALPFLLLVKNDPLLFLPIISIHLLVFSSWIAWQGSKATKQQAKLAAEQGEAPKEEEGNIAWGYLKKALGIMIVPKLIGVFGLLTLPGDIVTGVIFVIVAVFAVSYILNKPFYTNNKFLDTTFLMLGGYVSGTSLIGAPLIVSVFATKVPRHQLRDTLFVLWFILVMIKMVSFLIAGVDLQLIHQLWLLPCALLGHVFGQKLHSRVQKAETPVFFQFVGWALLTVCGFGLYSTFML